jgi:hypothetical protein
VALDLFDDVLLLHFPLEAAERVLKSFTFLESYFCQFESHPLTDQKLHLVNQVTDIIGAYAGKSSTDFRASAPNRFDCTTPSCWK